MGLTVWVDHNKLAQPRKSSTISLPKLLSSVAAQDEGAPPAKSIFLILVFQLLMAGVKFPYICVNPKSFNSLSFSWLSQNQLKIRISLGIISLTTAGRTAPGVL